MAEIHLKSSSWWVCGCSMKFTRSCLRQALDTHRGGIFLCHQNQWKKNLPPTTKHTFEEKWKRKARNTSSPKWIEVKPHSFDNNKTLSPRCHATRWRIRIFFPSSAEGESKIEMWKCSCNRKKRTGVKEKNARKKTRRRFAWKMLAKKIINFMCSSWDMRQTKRRVGESSSARFKGAQNNCGNKFLYEYHENGNEHCTRRRRTATAAPAEKSVTEKIAIIPFT